MLGEEGSGEKMRYRKSRGGEGEEEREGEGDLISDVVESSQGDNERRRWMERDGAYLTDRRKGKSKSRDGERGRKGKREKVSY